MSGTTDKELLERFRDPATKEAAFEDIMRMHREKIYWYVRRMVADYDDAFDVTQDVFIKAWRKLEGFRGASAIGTWLYRIATNEALNFLKKKRRHPLVPLDRVSDQLLAALDSGRYISGDEVVLKLEKAVLLLPAKQRTVFILRYFEEKPYEEIAGITGTSQGALQAAYHHAVKKIGKSVALDEPL